VEDNNLTEKIEYFCTCLTKTKCIALILCELHSAEILNFPS